MQVYVREEVLKHTATADLASAAMAETTSFGKPWQLLAVLIKFDASSSNTITITRDTSTGASYDTIIKLETLSSATDFSWRPDNEYLDTSDEIKVQINKTGSANAYLTIVGKEL